MDNNDTMDLFGDVESILRTGDTLQTDFFTFGIQALPQSSHGYYRWGCRCAIVGCVLMLLLWMGSIAWR